MVGDARRAGDFANGSVGVSLRWVHADGGRSRERIGRDGRETCVNFIHYLHCSTLPSK